MSEIDLLSMEELKLMRMEADKTTTRPSDRKWDVKRIMATFDALLQAHSTLSSEGRYVHVTTMIMECPHCHEYTHAPLYWKKEGE